MIKIELLVLYNIMAHITQRYPIRIPDNISIVRFDPNADTNKSSAGDLFCLLIGNNRIVVKQDRLALKNNNSIFLQIVFKQGLALPPKGFFSFTFLEKHYFIAQEYNIQFSNVVYDILGYKSHGIVNEELWMQLNPPTPTDAFALQLSICGFDQGKFIIDTLIVHILDPTICSYFRTKIS
jgi:hypothetical protein